MVAMQSATSRIAIGLAPSSDDPKDKTLYFDQSRQILDFINRIPFARGVGEKWKSMIRSWCRHPSKVRVPTTPITCIAI